MARFQYAIKNKQTLEFELEDKVFVPTGTSSLLIQAVRQTIPAPGKILDLGCGAGITGISLNHLGLVKGQIYASDLSADAVRCTKNNGLIHGCELTARTGSLFEPWKGELFDYIVDDVSGVAEAVAEISPWFENVPCFSGKDGTKLICQILEQAPMFLDNKGLLFFPVISLSNVEKILQTANKYFPNVERVIQQTWPIPPSMMKHMELLLKLNDEGIIKVEHKFGTLLWTTEIYIASKTINGKV
jgi:methylase of polypeptide subunit release factors